MRLPLLALAASLLTAPGAAAIPPADSPRIELSPLLRPEPLEVRFYDPYRLLSREAEEWIRRETVLVFEASGIGIRFVARGGPGVIPATLYPELPEHWDVAPHAMGVAIGVHGGRRSIFLSLGETERALGVPRSQRTGWDAARRRVRRRAADRQPRRLGIGLGRVLAHELTHTIAPDCPHTRSGLMAERLSRRMLTAPGLRFDALATRHLREAAAGLGTDAPQPG